MVDQADLGQYVTYPIDIVKFKKGPTPDPEDNNALWDITYGPTDPRPPWLGNTRDYNATYSYNEQKCEWTDQCPTSPPSSAPSASPSDEPSLIPSTLPSDAPSGSPSTLPSSIPSDEPSSVPSVSPSVS